MIKIEACAIGRDPINLIYIAEKYSLQRRESGKLAWRFEGYLVSEPGYSKSYKDLYKKVSSTGLIFLGYTGLYMSILNAIYLPVWNIDRELRGQLSPWRAFRHKMKMAGL